MTREEAVNILRYVEAHGSLVKEAKEKAIEALEQESCITMRDLSDKELKHFAEEMKKVRVQVVKQEPILDKIRAEIEHVIDYTYDSTDYDKALYDRAYKDGLYEALEIIDKHTSGKGQSE